MKRMKKLGRVFLSVLLSTVLLSGSLSISGMAAENSILEDGQAEGPKVEVLEAVVIEEVDINPYTMLAECIISVTGDSDGMHIGITTGAVGTASVLGVKDVKIWKKNRYGNWDLVAISSGGEVHDRSIMGVSILYGDAIKSATYKITCVHYGNVNGYTEGENDSGEFVFNFN